MGFSYCWSLYSTTSSRPLSNLAKTDEAFFSPSLGSCIGPTADWISAVGAATTARTELFHAGTFFLYVDMMVAAKSKYDASSSTINQTDQPHWTLTYVSSSHAVPDKSCRLDVLVRMLEKEDLALVFLRGLEGRGSTTY